jgi:hypothetical protein
VKTPESESLGTPSMEMFLVKERQFSLYLGLITLTDFIDKFLRDSPHLKIRDRNFIASHFVAYASVLLARVCFGSDLLVFVRNDEQRQRIAQLIFKAAAFSETANKFSLHPNYTQFLARYFQEVLSEMEKPQGENPGYDFGVVFTMIFLEDSFDSGQDNPNEQAKMLLEMFRTNDFRALCSTGELIYQTILEFTDKIKDMLRQLEK